MVAVLALLALPAGAVAHPIDQATPQHPHDTSDDGGSSALVIAAVVVGVVALAGALYGMKQIQARAEEQDQADGTEGPAAAGG